MAHPVYQISKVGVAASAGTFAATGIISTGVVALEQTAAQVVADARMAGSALAPHVANLTRAAYVNSVRHGSGSLSAIKNAKLLPAEVFAAGYGAGFTTSVAERLFPGNTFAGFISEVGGDIGGEALDGPLSEIFTTGYSAGQESVRLIME